VVKLGIDENEKSQFVGFYDCGLGAVVSILRDRWNNMCENIGQHALLLPKYTILFPKV
jgi:hypothetical protein